MVARSRAELLISVHRHRLRREDLEDRLSQATLELITQARSGRRYEGRRHIANALEQRFLSRIDDRRRAVSGRSPMHAALESAVRIAPSPEESVDVEDARAGTEELLIQRERLSQISAVARRLSDDQRLVIASQVALGMGCREFCGEHGWSAEKYRKVGQRGRARLKKMLAEFDGSVPLEVLPTEETSGMQP